MSMPITAPRERSRAAAARPKLGLLFQVSGAPEISPETGLAAKNGVKPNFLTCENALLWGWGHGPERWAFPGA
jgi:hypothetical protein